MIWWVRPEPPSPSEIKYWICHCVNTCAWRKYVKMPPGREHTKIRQNTNYSSYLHQSKETFFLEYLPETNALL